MAEPKVYEGLSKLPHEFTVIHSLPYLATILKQVSHRNIAIAQIDFLILHPELGFLVIEVKGGRIKYEHPYFMTTRGERLDPFAQLDRNVFALPKLLKGAGGPHIVLGFALAFPEAIMHGKLVPPITVDYTNYPSEAVIIDSSDMRELSERVISIMRYWKRALKPPSYTQEEIDGIVALLCPTVDYVLPWSERIASDTERWLSFTNEQSRELQRLASQQRTVLTGRSGTGKTILALARARELTLQGKKVLFVLYNAAISDKVAKQLSGTGVDVSTFHNLCRRAYSSLNRSWEKTDEWYYVEGPDTLQEAINKNLIAPKNGGRYDALIIDEAQVLADSWLRMLTEWFDGNPVLVCCDDSQILPFEHHALPAEIIAEVVDAPIRWLTVNIRSPRRVYERLEETLPEKMAQTCSIRDDEPDTLEEIVTADPCAELIRVLDELHAQGVRRQDIAVLYLGTEPKLPPQIRSQFAVYMPVPKFRGMEAPIVIIYVPEIIERFSLDRNTMACAYGRATTRCLAIYPLEAFVTTVTHELLNLHVTADQPQHDFLQMIRQNPSVQEQLQEMWPIQKTLSLTEVDRLSQSVCWSQSLGCWLFEQKFNEPPENSIERLLLTRHLITTTNNPVIHGWFGNTDMSRIERWPVSTFIDEGIKSISYRMRWCSNCHRWTPREQIEDHLFESCKMCDQAHMMLSTETIDQLQGELRILKNPDVYSVEEKRQLSAFLICLGRYRKLSDKDKRYISLFVNRKLKNSYAVSKVLVGINILGLNEGEEVDIKRWSKNYWSAIPWLHNRIKEESWRKSVERSLNAFYQHKWLIKANPQAPYVRIPLPPVGGIASDVE